MATTSRGKCRENTAGLSIAKATAIVVGTGEASSRCSTAPLWIGHDFHHPHSRMRKLRLKEVTSAAQVFPAGKRNGRGTAPIWPQVSLLVKQQLRPGQNLWEQSLCSVWLQTGERHGHQGALYTSGPLTRLPGCCPRGFWSQTVPQCCPQAAACPSIGDTPILVRKSPDWANRPRV